MNRYLEKLLKKDLENKIVILMGPRQSGKTTLSKRLDLSYDYLNMDNNDHVAQIIKKHWDRNKELLILDEFHKLKHWKKFIKGVYDTEGLQPKILITGSAKLDTFKNVGDSLAGRYFSYRLYPIDLHEACCSLGTSPQEAFRQLSSCSGFPEPFLRGEASYYKRWHKTHNEIMLQQDLIDLTAVKEIKLITLLATLLKQRIGSGVNYANLARDLQVSSISIKKWVEILENMYMFFKITPYHRSIARSLLREPKIYCYDVALISSAAIQLENIVAISLLKRLHYLEDSLGKEVALHYCRTKDGKEIDFLVKVEQLYYLIEVKTSDSTPSPHFAYFKKYFTKVKCIQLVKNLDREYSTPAGCSVYNLLNWLANIDQHI